MKNPFPKLKKLKPATMSYFMKNYISYMLLIIVSFSLTTAVFISQVSIYSLEEKEASLSSTINRVRELTKIMVSSNVSSHDTLVSLYSVNMMQIAEESNSTLIVSDLSGNINFYYDSNQPEYKKTKMMHSIITRTLYDGTYSEVGDLLGFFDETSYIKSTIVYDETNTPVNFIMISMPATSIITLFFDLSKMFFYILCIVLMVIFAVSYVITSNITKPLITISNAASKFANGDFSVRVSENTNCIEIDNLSKSINDMAKALEVSEKHRNIFIENVSHELKTPMTSIGGFVDGILDGTIPKERQPYYLKIISDEVKRLSRLTVRMLKTSKIQSDAFTITRSPFDFTDIISRVLVSFETKIIQKELDIDVDLIDNALVFGDRDNIYQVLYNLTDNAIKFTKSTETLKMRLYLKDKEAVFEISNQGTISPEKLGHIFDRFYKVDESRSEDTTGAGLGLYIVKKIVTMHERDIVVKCENGFTTFTFSLPLNEVPKQPKSIKTAISPKINIPRKPK